jgi:peptidylprolyl isomerase domain and WD repeat-containing protein 1
MKQASGEIEDSGQKRILEEEHETHGIDMEKEKDDNAGNVEGKSNHKNKQAKKRKLNNEKTAVQIKQALHQAPEARPHYEISYMHRDVVTRMVYSHAHGYVLTASNDGIIKFWKRLALTTATSAANPKPGEGGATKKNLVPTKGLEFIKSYTAHTKAILSLCLDASGDTAASVGADQAIQLYDVSTFDVKSRIDCASTKKAQSPSFFLDQHGGLGYHSAFVTKDQSLLVISSNSTNAKKRSDSSKTGCAIYVFNTLTTSTIPIQILSLHAAPVTTLGYSLVHNCGISTDVNGTIEIWDCAIRYDTPIAGPTSDDRGQLSEDGNSDDADPLLSQERTIRIGHAPTDQHNHISWQEKGKMATSLYEFMKQKIVPISLAIAPNGSTFCLYGSDSKLRVFDFRKGKLKVAYDESDAMYRNHISNTTNSEKYAMDSMEYGKRAATEREITETTTVFTGGVPVEGAYYDEEDQVHQLLQMTYDNSSDLLLYPTLVGIKVIHLPTHKCKRVVGKVDASSHRFVGVCLCSGQVKRDTQLELARTGGSSAAMQADENNKGVMPDVDPLLIVNAYQKKRLYVFSNRDPIEALDKAAMASSNITGNAAAATDEQQDEEAIQRAFADRNVMNEPPDADDLHNHGSAYHRGGGAHGGQPSNDVLGREAVLRTTLGDIHFKLFGELCPRTIENFCTHARQGYYDNVIFHRVIKGFMIQTGDPLGDGTGGESMWGGEFEDEFNREYVYCTHHSK